MAKGKRKRCPYCNELLYPTRRGDGDHQDRILEFIRDQQLLGLPVTKVAIRKGVQGKTALLVTALDDLLMLGVVRETQTLLTPARGGRSVQTFELVNQ